MQMFLSPIYGSGLAGLLVPSSRSLKEEQRLVRWLNDEWLDQESAWTAWWHGKGPQPDRPNAEDDPARKVIISDFIPRLRGAQRLVSMTPEEGLRRGEIEMARQPARWNDLNEAACEVSGVNDRARALRILQRYKLVPSLPISPRSGGYYIVDATNKTEAWAAHVLLRMAADGSFEKLVQCDCLCGKWFIKRRGVDRFAKGCRVRFHQSGPAFRSSRNARLRENYAREKQRAVKEAILSGIDPKNLKAMRHFLAKKRSK